MSAGRRSRRVRGNPGLLLLGWLSVLASACERPAAPPATAATALVADRTAIDRSAINSESRSTLRGRTHEFALTVPRDAELDVAFGVPGAGPAWKRWPSDVERVEFRVVFAHGGERETLVRHRIERPTQGDSTWHDRIVDLRPFADRRGTLILEADAEPPTVFLQPTPLIYNGIPVSIPRLPPVVWTVPRIRQPAKSTATNVILVSIDTLRADHLGCYGYDRSTSAHIDRMAAEGVLFRNAVASSPWTLPSHGSMLTGLEPARHGAVRFAFVPMSHGLDTLTELLWDAGYETAGFVGGAFVSNFFGMGQGFDRFWENPASQSEMDTLQANLDLAKAWMDGRRGAPFFLFLHTYQVHLPYTPSAAALAHLGATYADGEASFTSAEVRRLLKAGRYPPHTLDRMRTLYDGEIVDMDAVVKQLLDYLRASGLDRNTCVLFTSDHGDEFGEHGDIQHAKAKLYQELVHVPLIVWCPSRFRGGRSVSELASHTDLLPTVLEIAGLTPPPDLDGTSLLPLLRGDAAVPRAVAFSEVDGSTEGKQGTVRAMRGPRYKVIESSIDGSELLFDLPADPGETRDMRTTLPDVLRELRLAAGSRQGARIVADESPPMTPDDAVRERLRALGYVD